MQPYILFILAFLIRLINLNQSLWLDEAVVAKVVKSIPFFQIPLQFSPGDFHPPLYYLFMSIWSSLFGYSEITLRMPSLFFSLIAGWYVYKIGTELKGKTVGIWAAAFFLFNPLIVYYSQEARMYMMATAFLSIALYYFLRMSLRAGSVQALRSNPLESATAISWLRNDMVLFNIFSALAMATFYGSAFFIGGMIVGGAFVIPIVYPELAEGKIGIQQGKLYRFRIRFGITIILCVGFVISLLLLSPLLIQQLANAKTGLLEVKNWSLVLGKAEFKNVFMILLKFSAGRISWYPKWSYYMVVGLWSIVVGVIILLGMKKNKLFASLFIMPLVIGLFVSFWAPMMMYFRFIYLIPVMSILLSIAIVPSKHKVINWIPTFVGMTVFIVYSLIYLLLPQFHREDWKKMVSDINPTQPTYMIIPSSDPVRYYDSGISVYELRDIQKAVLPEHIQVIPYVEEIYGYNHIDILKKKGCVRGLRSEYRGPLVLEQWTCSSSFVGHKGVSAI